MAKVVRMADIADALGISIVSVSKALSGKEGISDETRTKIIDKANELGYKTSTASLTKNKIVAGNKVVGILVAERFFDENAFYTKLYRELIQQCTLQGFSVMLEIQSPADEKNLNIPTFVRERRVDGLIFMGEVQADYIRNIVKCGVPYLLLDFFNDELGADVVTSDNVRGGYMLATEIIKSGKTKIGFVGSVKQTSSNMDRYLGMTKAVAMHNAETRWEWLFEDRDEYGMFIPIKLPAELPQAFVCSCDEVAYNVINAVKARGLRVPEDIAVTGYDDFRYSTLSEPAITTYQVDSKGMAVAAVAHLKKKIEGGDTSEQSIVIKGKLIKRDSV